MKKILSSVVAGLFAVTLFAFPAASFAQDETGPSLQTEQPTTAPVTKSKKKTHKTKKTSKKSSKAHAKKSPKKSSKKQSSM